MEEALDRRDLDAAAQAGIITSEQAEQLTVFFAAKPQGTAVTPAKFDFSHLLWYAGALIVIGAMTLFTTVAFEQSGGRALTWTAIAYAFGFVLLGRALWNRPGLKVPAGVLIACAAPLAPLVLYSVE